jgi:hypothetical protein
MVPPLYALSLSFLCRNSISCELRVRWTRDGALLLSFLEKVNWSSTFLPPCSSIETQNTNCTLTIQSGPSSDTMLLFLLFLFLCKYFPSLGLKVKMSHNLVCFKVEQCNTAACCEMFELFTVAWTYPSICNGPRCMSQCLPFVIVSPSCLIYRILAPFAEVMAGCRWLWGAFMTFREV